MTAIAERLALSWDHAVKRRAVKWRMGVMLPSMANVIITDLIAGR